MMRVTLDQAPMASLLSSPLGIPSPRQLTIVHITNSLKEIKKSKVLLASGGGLGACVYGVPVNDNMQLHNLGSYIYRHELPSFLKAQNKKSNIGIIAIRFKNATNDLNIEKIDYLSFGTIYLSAFKNAIKRSQLLLANFEQELITQLRINEKFLLKVNAEFGDTSEFIGQFNDFVTQFPVARLVYFETILEYCFLFQNDDHAFEYKLKGELFNDNVKNMIFELNPQMLERFSMMNFRSTPQEIVSYIENKSRAKKFILDFNSDHFYTFLHERFVYNFINRLQLGKKLVKIASTPSVLEEDCPGLIGHMLFRNYKSIFDVENEIARILWRQWQGNRDSILCYKYLPKGEIGIASTTTEKYEVFEARFIEPRKIELVGNIEVKISNELINPKNTVMRKPYDIDNSK